MYPSNDDTEFIPPPEAPVFEPDEEEWKDPLGFIAKIHPYVVKVGICKIRPPPEWQPTFSVDVDKFRFTPRIQKLHELEARTRVKMNFIDGIAKFWELQGTFAKTPNIEKKPLDLYELHKIVQAEGGYEDVTRLRRWSRVALLMGFSSSQTSGILRKHYEKILYPYDVFVSGAMTGEGNPPSPSLEKSNDRQENTLEPPSYSSRTTRRSKYKSDEGQIDYVKNPELKKLQFLAPGPKITGSKAVEGRQKKRNKRYDDSFIDDVEYDAIQGSAPRKEEKNIFSVVASWDINNYRCVVCESGDDEHAMLLCDACDNSYHTFCLIPPLNTIPHGDWRCPKCVAKECSKPTEDYGFEQAGRNYSLQDFGEMADKFKEEYFSMPPHEVPLKVTEKEFWRLVQSVKDNISVEYGADLHTKDLGSGFPMPGLTDDPDDMPYANSPWNLNNFATNEKSVLRHVTQNISGMKIPWIYIGMCFSSFCWHTEDHWSYSINYCHWGEPKTWYGVPQQDAEKLEKCIMGLAPELFEKNPDLFHHLVTTCSPMTLMDSGVSVYRTDQHAGEFVITFPRAYHAGFNQGYNCAEAVNFCPADWLTTGYECIKHYRMLKRDVVFSHEELVCKMASVPETLDLDLAKKLYENMKVLVNVEIQDRTALHEKGIKDREHVPFELLAEDDRQCLFCKAMLYFSGVVCSCDNKRYACLKHVDELCVCQNLKKHIRYRYTLTELPEILANLKKRADSFDNWAKQVQKALSCSTEERLELNAFKDLISESEESVYPDCELLEQLKSAVVEAEQCAQVASTLIAKKHKTRKSSTSTPTQQPPRLTLEELRDFVLQVQNLPCTIKEAKAVDMLMAKIESFRYDARVVLNSETYDETRATELLEHSDQLDIELPEMQELKLDLKASKWLERMEQVLSQDAPISLDVIRSCVDQGIGLKKKQASAGPLSKLKELLYAADRWEEKAKLCLNAKPRHQLNTLEVIVQEASKVKITLPNVSALREALEKAKAWSNRVEGMQSERFYPYYDVLEELVTSGRPIPVRLELLASMESQVSASKTWKERVSRAFLKKGSHKQLVEVIQPRKDVGKFVAKVRKKKYNKYADPAETDKTSEAKSRRMSETKTEEVVVKEEPMDIVVKEEEKEEAVDPAKKILSPEEVAEVLKDESNDEVSAMRDLRVKNLAKLRDENIEGPYCLCRKSIEGLMVRCSLCCEWYHTTCIVVPKTIYGKPIGKGFTALAAFKEVHYLCPLCCRSRRPRLDNILAFLFSMQKIPVRTPEGEALQALTERAMHWQERAKVLLNLEAIQRVVNDVKKEIDLQAKQITNTLIVQRLLAVQVRKGAEDSKTDEVVDCKMNEGMAETKTNELECAEEMSSPHKEQPTDLSNPEVVRIQSTSSSRAQSPIDVCALPADTKLPENIVAETKPPAAVLTMPRLAESVLDEMESLLCEGDLLEVGLDETQIMWVLLQVQRPLPKEHAMILNSDYRRKLVKERKRQRKRKLDDEKQQQKESEQIAKKQAKQIKKEKVAPPPTPPPAPVVVVKKEEEEGDEEQDEDDCAAKPCLKPLGEEVEWVLCDKCESWFHCVCVKISAEEANSADQYTCPYCQPPKPAKSSSNSQKSTESVAKPVKSLQNTVEKSTLATKASTAQKSTEKAAEPINASKSVKCAAHITKKTSWDPKNSPSRSSESLNTTQVTLSSKSSPNTVIISPAKSSATPKQQTEFSSAVPDESMDVVGAQNSLAGSASEPPPVHAASSDITCAVAATVVESPVNSSDTITNEQSEPMEIPNVSMPEVSSPTLPSTPPKISTGDTPVASSSSKIVHYSPDKHLVSSSDQPSAIPTAMLREPFIPAASLCHHVDTATTSFSEPFSTEASVYQVFSTQTILPANTTTSTLPADGVSPQDIGSSSLDHQPSETAIPEVSSTSSPTKIDVRNPTHGVTSILEVGIVSENLPTESPTRLRQSSAVISMADSTSMEVDDSVAADTTSFDDNHDTMTSLESNDVATITSIDDVTSSHEIASERQVLTGSDTTEITTSNFSADSTDNNDSSEHIFHQPCDVTNHRDNNEVVTSDLISPKNNDT